MSQQFWKKVLPFAFSLAFLVACGEGETQPSKTVTGENNSQSETDAQNEDDTQTENNEQSDENHDSELENDNHFDIEAEDGTDYGTSLWKTYENWRFVYSIHYPSSWNVGEQSENGDGLIFYEGDPNNDIRIYGSLYDADLYDPYSDASKDGFTTDKITLNNGDEADYIVGMEDGKVLFKVIFIEDYVVYTFYANVTVDFFDENVGLLVQTAKSLDVKELEE